MKNNNKFNMKKTIIICIGICVILIFSYIKINTFFVFPINDTEVVENKSLDISSNLTCNEYFFKEKCAYSGASCESTCYHVCSDAGFLGHKAETIGGGKCYSTCDCHCKGCNNAI